MHKPLTKELFRGYALAGTEFAEIIRVLKIGHGTAFRWRNELGLAKRKRGNGAPCMQDKKKTVKRA